MLVTCTQLINMNSKSVNPKTADLRANRKLGLEFVLELP